MTTINLDNFFQSIKATLDQIKTDLSSIGIDVNYVGPGSEIDGDGNADDATITFGTASETLITDADTNGIYSGNGYFTTRLSEARATTCSSAAPGRMPPTIPT
jgi:hypothetical protein